MTVLAHLLTPGLAVLIVGAVLGGVVQGLSGFAFGMVSMSVWAWSINPHEATVLAVFGGLCGQVLSAIRVRPRANTSEVLPFLIAGLVGVAIGTGLLPHIAATQFKLLLGAVLAIGCPLMLGAARARFAEAIGKAGDGAAGFVGGIIGGISGLTGVAPAIWGAIRGFDKSKQRDLLQTFNMATLTATLVALTSKGVVTSEMAPRLGIVVVALLLPLLIGVRIYQRLPDATFRRLVLALLTASGMALFVSGLASGEVAA